MEGSWTWHNHCWYELDTILSYLNRLYTGPDIKFYAIIALDTQFLLVGLTPAFSCIDAAAEGSDRNALYRAFTAASVLLARIDKDAKLDRFYRGPARFTRLPGISRLVKRKKNSFCDDYLNFRIVGKLENREHPHIYLAKTASYGETIVVKFVKQYCPVLHDICAKLGHAPKLLAYERLPGGWYAVAMQYIAHGVPLIQQSRKLIPRHFEKWKGDLEELVANFHEQGYVHGDLRNVNIICGDDGCVKLIDFDWGGWEGEVSYPDICLDLELIEGRTSDDLKIRKWDNLHILNATLEKIALRR
ncbi:hypothetical protein BDQ17DRAFT_1500273 [Cyathus striatus]|nr:hypothetical protein BDQ17DRAFT_1500273 [Cyathus striatus]